MRLLVATSSYPTRADEAINAGVFVRDIVAQLVTQGHDVHVLTPAKGVPVTGSPAPVRTFEWGGSEKVLTRLNPRRPIDLMRLARLMLGGRAAMRQFAKDIQADAIIAMWAIPAGFWATAVQRPYVVWVLGSDIWSVRRYPLGQAVVRHVLMSARYVFGNSYYLVDGVKQLAKREAEFLAAGRHLPVAQTPAARLDSSRPQFVFVGRWDRAKGVDVLLEAMGLVLERLPQAYLHVFGGGPLEADIRAQASQGRLRTNVAVNGFADPATVVAYCKACDALIIPSRIESVPVIYSDALQCGCPVVSTEVGDLGRLVREQHTGVVCPPENPAALADAICQFATEGPTARSTYAPKLAAAAEMFDPARSAARCVEVLIDPGK